MEPERNLNIFYRARVRDVMTQSLTTSPASASVRAMAELMRERRLGAVIILADDRRPLGIVTERDLVYKALADGAGDLTALEVMSSPLITVGAEEHVHQAVYLMMKHKCRRLVVVDSEGHLSGFLSMRDLLRLGGYEAGMISTRIDTARDITALRALRPEIDEFIHVLFLSDFDGRSLAEILTDFNDAVVRRVIQLNIIRLEEERLHKPPVPFAWVCFGSEGRHEQVLRGDQDNGLILASSGSPGARDYFRRLASGVNEDLAAIGFELCKGGVMAREDQYFGGLDEWRDRVFGMIRGSQDGKTLRDLTIFLDCRLVEGEPSLVQDLWSFTHEHLQTFPPALRALADDAVTKPTALNFLGRLQYEKGPDGRRGINIKRWGMLPLVAGVKALAMERQVRTTGTAERIAALQQLGALERESASSLLSAHQLFLKLKLENSLEQAIHGQVGAHFFYPDEWTEWERQDLKRAFKAVDHLHDILKFHFIL